MAARRPPSALSPASVLRAGEDKGPFRRRIPPVVWATSPLNKLALRTPAVPGDSPPPPQQSRRIRSTQAAARWAEPRWGPRDWGFWPDASKARSGLGGARPAEVLPALADSSDPARPESGARSSATAGCAHRNTAGTPGQRSSRRYRPRPGNCRHAPDDRLCYAPKPGYPMLIG